MVVENFWKRVERSMEAGIWATGKVVAKIPLFGLPIEFAQAYYDELAKMAQEDKINEIHEIVKNADSQTVYENLKIEIDDEDLRKFNEALIPHLIEINSKLDILLEDHKRFEEKLDELEGKMERTLSIMTELQDGLLRNPTIMRQISNYGMPLPKPFESFLSHASIIFNDTLTLANQEKYKEALEELGKLEEERKREMKKAIAENRVFIWISARIDFQTGLIKQAEGLFGESISFFDSGLAKAFEIEDYEIVALSYYELGYSYGMMKDFQNGYESTKNAIEYAESYYPKISSQIYNNLGNFLKEFGRKEEAENAYRDAIRCEIGNPYAHYNLGNLLRELGKIEEAKKEYKIAIRYKSDYAKAYNNLGILFDDLGKKNEAKKFYKKAIKYQPDFAEAYYNLGVYYEYDDKGIRYGKGFRIADAIESYKKAIRCESGFAYAHNNLGVLLDRIGRKEEAEKEYREAIKYKPNLAMAYSNLGFLYAEMGKNKEAKEMLEKALDFKYDLPEGGEEKIIRGLTDLLSKEKDP